MISSTLPPIPLCAQSGALERECVALSPVHLRALFGWACVEMRCHAGKSNHRKKENRDHKQTPPGSRPRKTNPRSLGTNERAQARKKWLCETGNAPNAEKLQKVRNQGRPNDLLGNPQTHSQREGTTT